MKWLDNRREKKAAYERLEQQRQEWDEQHKPHKSWRYHFISINESFKELLGDRAQLVNVGTKPYDATGDPMHHALAKIAANLKLLLCQVNKSDE